MGANMSAAMLGPAALAIYVSHAHVHGLFVDKAVNLSHNAVDRRVPREWHD